MFRNRTAVAVAFVIGILVLGGLVGMSSIGSTTVSAAQIENRGGATESELNFALNFRRASNAEMFGANGMRMPDGAESAANAIDPQVGVDLENAVRAIAQLPCEAVDSSSMGGRSFGPGVYCLASANLVGSMTLDGAGDPNSRFVFRIAGDMRADAGASISVENGANAMNAYFVAGDEVSIGEGSHIAGTFVAGGNINLGAGADLRGKALSVKGEVNAAEANIAAQTGWVEVCKELADGEVVITPGTLFTFDVAGTTVTAPAGACAPRVQVTAGNVTITEASRANTAVVNIRTEPIDRLVSSNLGLRQAVVSVPAGEFNSATLVFFRNQTTRTGSLEICKYGLDLDVTGSFFFTVQGVPAASNNFSVPVGFCSDIITTTIPQVGTTPFNAIVTELARPTFRLELVDTLPLGRNTPATPPGFVPDLGYNAAGAPISNVNGGYTNVLLNAGGTEQMVLVNFYNRSLPGRVKVCKFLAQLPAGQPQIPTTTAFIFTVVGTAPTSPTQTMPGTPGTSVTISVLPNSCTIVPGTWIVGTTVVVTEIGMNPASFTTGGVTYTFADIRVSRIAANPASALVSSNLANKTATLTVRNSLIEVDFTNFLFRPAIVKLCKAGGTGVTGNASFTLSLVDPLTSWAVSTAAITIPVGGCTIIDGPFPGIAAFPVPNANPPRLYGTFNLGTLLTITEAASANVLTSITSPTGNTISRSGLAGTITLNQAPNNINEIRFLNSLPVPQSEGAARFDFDGDGSSDMAIYRNGTWWYAASGSNMAQSAIQFGSAGDKLVAADYDGDGKTDAAVYRNGTWYVLRSTLGLVQFQFGLPTDIPQPGDFDGDGKADFAVYRPSEGVWYMQNSSTGFSAVQFGISSDKPVSADFDGDGKTDQAVYRGGTWYVLGSTNGFYGAQFGIASDIPVQADFDGDNKADFAVYRGGTWHVLGSTSGYSAAQFGMATDTPVPADYDGDGKTDFAVYRTSTTEWHILKSSLAQTLSGGYVAAQFGSSNDVLMNY